MSDSAHNGQPYVFISYASADRERVLAVIAALQDSGISVWRDESDIVGGFSYGPAIAGAIRGSSAVIVLCTQAALTSRNVRQEIAIAWKHERPCVPLILDRVTSLPEEVEYWLEGAQWIEVLDHATKVWLPKVIAAASAVGVTAPTDTVPTVRLGRADASPPVTAKVSIPTPLTGLIGRRVELEQVSDLLRTSRLVTLTGPGGTGKTRLSIAVAQAMTASFADGVMFVPLAAIRDSALVIPTIATAFDVREAGSDPLLSTLSRALAERHLLLVLDNFEHVSNAAPDVVSLLTNCSQLHMLVTSRVPLHVSGEREYAVSPLSTPGIDRQLDLQALAEMPSVSLFVDRAQAVKHEFCLTSDNAIAVAEICRRLDGLPLALELAAARVKVLSPQALLERLSDPLRVLTGGARNLPDRQQTMRDTLQWSYELLDDDEKRLFQRLAVFLGGWTFDGAQAVATAGGWSEIDVLDGVTSLVEQSLVIERATPGGEARLQLLELIREFALEQFNAQDDACVVRQAHLAYVTSLAERAEPWLLTTERETWLVRLDAERDNFRAALQHSIDASDFESGLRLAGALGWYWYLRGYLREGQEWFSRLGVTAVRDEPTQVAAKAITGAARLAFYGTAGVLRPLKNDLADTGVQLWRRLGDPRGLAHALVVHALAGQPHNHGEDEADLLESRELFRSIGDAWGEGQALLYLGAFGILDSRRTPRSREASRVYLTEAAAIFRTLNDAWQLRGVLSYLGLVAEDDGDLIAALTIHEESVALMRTSHDRWRLMLGLSRLSLLAFRLGDDERASAGFEEVLSIAEGLGQRDAVGSSLVALGRIWLRRGEMERAERMFRSGLDIATDLALAANVGISLRCLGDVALARGQPEQALDFYCQSLRTLSTVTQPTIDMNETQPAVACVSGCAVALWQLGDRDAAVALLPAIDHHWRTIQSPAIQSERTRYDELLVPLRACARQLASDQLGEDAIPSLDAAFAHILGARMD